MVPITGWGIDPSRITAFLGKFDGFWAITLLIFSGLGRVYTHRRERYTVGFVVVV